MKRVLVILATVVLGVAVGCISSSVSPERATPQTSEAILYHRTGGIAGTDDRVVIWPDGLVQVRGKVMPEGEAWLSKEKLRDLRTALAGWSSLQAEYPFKGADDAYTIQITCGGKTVTASDLCPDLPEPFKRAYQAIEAAAAGVTTASSSAP